jgi:co-chaperonin GroES (HSP10)
MKIKPMGARILLDLDQSPEITASGLIIAQVPDKDGDYVRVLPARGTVLACGPEVQDLCEGDYVIVDKYHGISLPRMAISGLTREDLLIVKEAFVMLVQEDKSGEGCKEGVLRGQSER